MIVSPNIGTSVHYIPLQLYTFLPRHIRLPTSGFSAVEPVLSASSLCPFIRGMTEKNIETVISALTSISFLNIHGVSNTNRCAEGVSQDDEFRIVQTSPTPRDPREGLF